MLFLERLARILGTRYSVTTDCAVDDGKVTHGFLFRGNAEAWAAAVRSVGLSAEITPS